MRDCCLFIMMSVAMVACQILVLLSGGGSLLALVVSRIENLKASPKARHKSVLTLSRKGDPPAEALGSVLKRISAEVFMYQTIKLSFSFIVPILLFSCSLFFCSCSSDDGDSSNGSSSSSGQGYCQVTTSEGTTMWITSAGDIDFSFEDTILTGISSYDCLEMTVSYSPLSFDFSWTDEEDEDWSTVLKSLSTNSSGYITKMQIYNYSSSGITHNITTSFSYNDSGRLIGYSESYTGSESGSTNAEFTWNGGILESIAVSYDYLDDDWQETGEMTFGFEYDYDYPNVSCCYSPAIAYQISEYFWSFEVIEPLFYGGFLGKGTTYLPTSGSCIYYDEEDEREYEDSYKITNSLNDNGTIKSCRISGYFSVSLSYADYND